MVFPVYVAGSAMLAGIGFGLTTIGFIVGAIIRPVHILARLAFLFLT